MEYNSNCEFDSFLESDAYGNFHEKTSKSQFYSPNDIYALEDHYLQSLPRYLIDGSMGIDGLTVSLSLDEDSLDLAFFLANLIGKGNKTKGAVSLPNMPSAWIFWPSTDIRQRLKINFNPSNFSRIDGFEICPPPLLFYYVEKAIRTILCKGDPGARPQFMAAEPYGKVSPWPEYWPREIEVFQAHYARDIVITDPGFSMELLQDTKPKYAKATLTYRNAGVIETISHPHSKKVAKHSFYDKYRERERLLKSKKKYRESYNPVPKGTKRYEVQATRAELKKFNHETLDVFTVERIMKATKSYWKLSNYGNVVDLEIFG
jgi:hypothetical protein